MMVEVCGAVQILSCHRQQGFGVGDWGVVMCSSAGTSLVQGCHSLIEAGMHAYRRMCGLGWGHGGSFRCGSLSLVSFRFVGRLGLWHGPQGRVATGTSV